VLAETANFRAISRKNGTDLARECHFELEKKMCRQELAAPRVPKLSILPYPSFLSPDFLIPLPS